MLHEQHIASFKKAAGHFIDVIAKDWPRLADKMLSEVDAQLLETELATAKKLKKLLELENLPCTENPNFIDTVNNIRNHRLKATIDVMKTREGTITVQNALKLMKSDLVDFSNNSKAVQDMIDVLSSYWKVASKRIIDGVVMVLIEAYASKNHIANIGKRLLDDIALSSDGERLQNLFVEPPRKKARREELMETEARMRNAQDRLRQGFY